MQLRSLSSKFKRGLDKWRLVFLIFLAIYALLLLLDLGYMAIQWDEASHLDGGLLLLHGDLQKYLESSMFYPPLSDLMIAGYFGVGGASVFAGRLVSVTFAILAVGVLFEFTRRVYGPRTALVAGILLGTMPGFIWLSRVALLETMLIFFFSTSMLLFFTWLRKHDDRLLFLSGIALGLGFLTKYQTSVALIAMVTSIFLLCRGYLKKKLARFTLLILTAAVIAIPWIVVSYNAYSSGLLEDWLYAMSVGNPDKSIYSVRFPTPVFYLIEMTWPYGVVHPISLFIYIFGLLGLGLLFWRRKPEDKFLLVWFTVVYVFFTLLGNRQWRYIVPIFPVLALSGASLITFVYGKAEKAWKLPQANLNRRRLWKIAGACTIAVTAFSIVYSGVDAYQWAAKDAAFNLPVEEATNYAVERLNGNESIMVLCPLNVFSQDIVRFYVHVNESKQSTVWQYPEQPVDTYTPTFSAEELIGICDERKVKYLLLFEYGGTYPYFNSPLTMQAVYQMLLDSKRFTFQTSLGKYPCRIYILTYAG
jgi:4-amino-4-deoxy-L-arabinose transferase-like glycosyltransferase